MTIPLLRTLEEADEILERIEKLRRELGEAVAAGRVNGTKAQHISERLDLQIVRYTRLEQSIHRLKQEADLL